MIEGGRPWRGAPLILMAASGFAGLGYQIVWTQQGALWLGHEAAAVLAVVAAFFGGLALGAFALGGRASETVWPARFYAACELVVGAWGLLLAFGMRPLGAGMLRLAALHPAAAWQWSVSFAGTFVAFLPATAAMGATLPAMERLTRARESGEGPIAALYASNTLGAVVGVLATAFAFVPGLGLARTAGACAALNLLCAVGAMVVFADRAGGSEPAATPDPLERRARRGALTRLALSGFLGIGYEALVVRVLSQVTEETVYTFALLLAVYLVGTATGAAGYRRWLGARREPEAIGDRLVAALAAAVVVGTTSLWAAEVTRASLQHALGGGVGAALAGEAALAVLAFGPATVVMGALFCHLAGRARAAGVGFGTALGVNTLGGAIAPAAWGVLAAPALGAKIALGLVALGYLALARRGTWRRPLVWGPAAAALALVLFAPPLAFVDIPVGGRVLSYREGVTAAVSVVEDADGVARLRIDNRQQEGSSATFRVDARQAWIPLLLHPAPRRALFLGLGTGVTAGAAAEDPALDVDAVELLPEVIEASTYFRPGAAPPRLHVVASDARRFVRTGDRLYDVVVSDNFHPARSGSGALYTVEHFEAVRRRLAPSGLFCQWLPLHQLDLQSLQSIVRSFLAAFPGASALLASNSLETPVVGLIGRADDGRFDAAALRQRLRRGLPGRAAGLGFEDELAVLGSFVAGPPALRRFADGAPLNTDDRPVVAYRAPRITYAADSAPRDRLLAFLGQVSVSPAEIVAESPESSWPGRLAAYWLARNRFVESGRDVTPSPRVEDMLAQVREPLLAVLRISPDFRPAYDPLLAMAAALAGSDAAGARALLAELARLQPARAEAPRVLSQLGVGAPSGP